MDADDILKRLYQQVDSCESVFLSPDDPQMFGIQASQIGMTEDGNLQFNPCFFLPYPERVLEKYPLRSNNMFPLNLRPDYDAILEKYKKKYPEAEAIKYATKECNNDLGLFADDLFLHAKQPCQHIEWQMKEKNRKGQPESLSFWDLAPPRTMMDWPIRCRCRSDPPLLHIGSGRPWWKVMDIQEDCAQSSLMAHAIMSVVSGVTADDADKSLTICEVIAIVATMICRTSHRPFQARRVHPILVVSYTGRNHGRIIQASLDGQCLTLQYSPLWSFEDHKTAPVELFIRYMMSESVERETSPIVGPMARLNIN